MNLNSMMGSCQGNVINISEPTNHLYAVQVNMMKMK